MTRDPSKRNIRPIDAEGLERLALFYVGRYATTRAKLAAYLQRKVRERGWEGAEPARIADLVDRIAGFGYVDDRRFAEAKAAGLSRRGFGRRRQDMALKAAGVSEDDRAATFEEAQADAMTIAVAFARRRRIGPFGSASDDPDARRRAFAAMMRAGHAPDVANRILEARTGDELTDDER